MPGTSGSLAAVERMGEIALVPLNAPGLDLLPHDRRGLASVLVSASVALDAAGVVVGGGEEALLRREVLVAMIARGDALHPKALGAIRAFAWRSWVCDSAPLTRRASLNLPPGEFRSALRAVMRREPRLIAPAMSEPDVLDLATGAIYDPGKSGRGAAGQGGDRVRDVVGRAADWLESAARVARGEQADVLSRAAKALRSRGPDAARDELARATSRFPIDLAPDGSVTELDGVRSAEFGDDGPRAVTALVAKGGPAGSKGLAWNLLRAQHLLVHAPLARAFPGDPDDLERVERHGEAATAAMWIARSRARARSDASEGHEGSVAREAPRASGAPGGIARELDACRLLLDTGRRGGTHSEVIAEAAAGFVREWFTGRVPGGPRIVAALQARGGVEMTARDGIVVPRIHDTARLFAGVDALAGGGFAGVTEGAAGGADGGDGGRGPGILPGGLRDRMLLAGVPDVIAWVPPGRDIASLLLP